MGVGTVVLTSLNVASRDDVIEVIATSSTESHPLQSLDEHDKMNPKNHLPHNYYHLTVPKLPGYLSGTGDLAASLLTVHLTLAPSDLKGALEKT